MGNIIGRIRYRVTRPFREYNLEERAIKAVSRNKEVPSPRHPSTTSLIEKSIKNLNPEIKEQLENPNPELESHLWQVFVTSEDVTPVQPMSKGSAERPLPMNRSPVQPAQYGYHDPKVVPYGKVRLKDVLEFLTKHREDPLQHTAVQIAAKYKLDEQLTGQVLKYFGMFRMVVPVEKTEKQEELLKRLQAASDHFPNTAELQRTLLGVPVLGKPAMGDKDGKLPIAQIKKQEQEKLPDVTLLDYKLYNPLPEGRKEGDQYFEKKEKSSKSSDQKTEIIESVPERSARHLKNSSRSEAQNSGRE